MSTSLVVAAGVTLVFAVLAYALRGVTGSGAVAGAVISFTIYAAAGPAAFAALVSVFVLTWAATRFGYSRKQTLGTAERDGGRNAFQVLANLGVAGAFAALYGAFNANPIFLVAMSAALLEAAADTVSSELGQACGTRARLITTLEEVPAGTDGGVTLIGTLAGFLAATIVGTVCAVTHLIPKNRVALTILAAIVGTVADSFLGALFERRGFLKNDSVNFLSTAVAAATGVLLFHLRP